MKKIFLSLLIAAVALPQLKAAEGDTLLQSLSIGGESGIGGGYELSPAFDPNVTSYSVMLECPAEEQNLTVTATARSGISIAYGGAAAADGTLQIAKAGNYGVEVTATAENGGTRTYTINIKQPLPETLLRRFWTDMIALNLDSTTNGGYNFTSFVWYVNGEIKEYLTNKFYYDPFPGGALKDGSLYHVVVTTSKGQTLQTCPYIYAAPDEAKVKAYPNPTHQGNKITVDLSDMSELPEYIEIFNSHGVLLKSVNTKQSAKINILMDYAQGIYVVKAGKYLQKILVIK